VCVTAVEEREGGVSRETAWMWLRGSALYPQGVQGPDVVFHVKLGGLWITSVDNFGRVGVSTDGDGDLRVGAVVRGASVAAKLTRDTGSGLG
jgi:hypothetical protein